MSDVRGLGTLVWFFWSAMLEYYPDRPVQSRGMFFWAVDGIVHGIGARSLTRQV